MRPGGTQTKRGAAVRMRRRLGLAPRAYALLSCSLVLVIAGVSAYGMTVPSMMQAHAAREPRVGHEVKSDLGTTTGYAWASVVAHIVFGADDADGAEAPDNEVTLANGKTIVLTNTKIIDRLSNNSVAATVNKVERQKEQDAQQSGKPGSSMWRTVGLLIPLANARLILEESYANVCVTLLFSPKKESDNEE